MKTKGKFKVKKFIVLFIAFLFSAAVANARPVVVELFTSQGCSSCPPADKVLGDIAEEYPDVLPLSMHVDYWNYLGWRDPFSSSDITTRQRKYAPKFNRGSVYTPQAVIDGRRQVTGSAKGRLFSYIKSVRRDMSDIPIKIEKTGGKLKVSIEASAAVASVSDILLIGYDSRHETNVGRGENSGHKLVNYNVVRSIQNIGSWDGKEKILLNDLPEGENYAVIIQEFGQGDIIGAAYIVK